MPTTVTLSRSGVSVDIDLLQRGGDLTIARDVGKPNLNFPVAAALDPIAQDQFSASDRFAIFGILVGPGAYSRAQSLAVDLVKAHSQGDPLLLDPTEVTGFDSKYEVGVPSESALEIDYRPGVRDRVDVALSLPVVSSTV